MFRMLEIINNNRRLESTGQRSISRQPRGQFNFRNGYNHRNVRTNLNRSITTTPSTITPSNSIVMTQNPVLQTPIHLNYLFYDTMIDVCANNLTTELSPNSSVQANGYYFSTFQYNHLNVRFFHNDALNVENISETLEHVITNINDREIQTILDEWADNNNTAEVMNNSLNQFQNMKNSDELIGKIGENVTHGEYIKYSSLLKNSSCPILLCEFQNDDIVSIFNGCKHAIHGSTYSKFVETFTKCPLCNNKLF